MLRMEYLVRDCSRWNHSVTCSHPLFTRPWRMQYSTLPMALNWVLCVTSQVHSPLANRVHAWNMHQSYLEVCSDHLPYYQLGTILLDGLWMVYLLFSKERLLRPWRCWHRRMVDLLYPDLVARTLLHALGSYHYLHGSLLHDYAQRLSQASKQQITKHVFWPWWWTWNLNFLRRLSKTCSSSRS